MSSIKKYEKKLREISILKQKPNPTYEEREKIEKEQYYKQYLPQSRKKILDVLPDEVQRHIWDYLDTNTKLNFYRRIFTPEYVNSKLSVLPSSKHTIDRLYSALKYIRVLSKHYKNDNSIYAHLGWYLDQDIGWFLDKDCLRYCSRILTSIIVVGIKQFTKIYKQSKSASEIEKHEKNLLQLFAKISPYVSGKNLV